MYLGLRGSAQDTAEDSAPVHTAQQGRIPSTHALEGVRVARDDHIGPHHLMPLGRALAFHSASPTVGVFPALGFTTARRLIQISTFLSHHLIVGLPC
jgi:hypothetical protein